MLMPKENTECIGGVYSLIMTSIILNGVIAVRACGACAGMMIVSPSLSRWTTPESRISHSPSRIVATASYGALCYYIPSSLSKENMVILPAFELTIIRLAILPSW